MTRASTYNIGLGIPFKVRKLGPTAALILLLLLGCGRIEQGDAENSVTVSVAVHADESPDILLEKAAQAMTAQTMSEEQLETAERQLKQCLLQSPENSKAFELSADLAVRRGDTTTSIGLYENAIRIAGNKAERPLLEKLSRNLLKAGRPYDSMRVLQQIGDQFTADAQCRYDLSGMATAFGVTEQAVPALRWLLQKGQSDAESLMILADPSRVKPDIESCKKALALSGEDRRTQYGIALYDAMSDRWKDAAERLEPIVSNHPDFVEAYSLYGLALIELGHDDRLLAWSAATPTLTVHCSLYWLALGKWEQSQGRHQDAAICFWESIRKNGVIYPEALTYLLMSLTQLKRDEEVKKLTVLAIQYAELRDAVMLHIERAGESQAACMKVAESLMTLGRIWEAEAWARLATTLPHEKLPDLRARYLAIRSRLNIDTPIQLPESSVAAKLDLSDLKRQAKRDPIFTTEAYNLSAKGQIHFVDEAKKRGWVHTNIPHSEKGKYTLSQTVGGGVAAIDFDCDGWTDLAAATLDGLPMQTNSSPNRLHRNLNGSFVDVTFLVGYTDEGYGQGIAVSDYNNDGFLDLFDANIGRNRLFRNNGDGTFSDVSDEVGLSGDRWTTSVALADLNGDGLVDIFEVNYCSGSAPYEHECQTKFGIGVCSPMSFNAEPDRIWQGKSSGVFEDVSETWMKPTAPGRGLGIVAGLLDESPGLDVLVSNDMTVNHLWSSASESSDYHLVDLGVIRGVATNGKSQSQASMGIAAGDADGDGDLDFLMTHFSDEYNTFYEQVASGFWSDQSYRCGFVDSSMKLLGFGTQWVDFDNNGDVELIVANGHVDRYVRDDIAYRMPAQVYERSENGRWEELPRSALGAYFEVDHLGRALARTDVNRDGRLDIAISHLDEPVSLLINQTTDSGHSIAISLKGTASPRDAVGARIVAKTEGQTRVFHVLTGDGYMAANEQRIHIGCSQASSIDEVTIYWPSGRVDHLGSLDTGREYIVVEGETQAFETSKLAPLN